MSAGTDKVVLVANNSHRMPEIAPGSADKMISGSIHDWKLIVVHSRNTSRLIDIDDAVAQAAEALFHAVMSSLTFAR